MTVHNYRLHQKVHEGSGETYGEDHMRDGMRRGVGAWTFNEDTDSQYKRCVALWASVIDHQVREAYGHIVGGADANAKSALQGQAQAWFTSVYSEDFHRVCEFANVDPHAVRKAFKEGVLTPETLISGERCRNGGKP